MLLNEGFHRLKNTALFCLGNGFITVRRVVFIFILYIILKNIFGYILWIWKRLLIKWIKYEQYFLILFSFFCIFLNKSLVYVLWKCCWKFRGTRQLFIKESRARFIKIRYYCLKELSRCFSSRNRKLLVSPFKASLLIPLGCKQHDWDMLLAQRIKMSNI